MKKKLGFTLAEVLITLSIIGVIAAIVLPALLSSYQYKSLGVKLSKFMSTTEDAARAYVVSNDIFNNNLSATTGLYTSIDRFANESFLMEKVWTPGVTNLKSDDNLKTDWSDHDNVRNTINVDTAGTVSAFTALATNVSQTAATTQELGQLRDGTYVSFYAFNTPVAPATLDDEWTTGMGNNPNIPDTAKVGSPAFGIIFDPNVPGLPANVRHRFAFVVTDLGYVYPSPYDACLWNLYASKWATKSAQFSSGQFCGDGANVAIMNAGTWNGKNPFDLD